jgi:dTDP-4-amino-4,6-dideoxygalactose transaminase
MSRIHLSKAHVTAVEEQYILNAISSGWVAPLGPDVDAFESEIAARAGVSHGLALASGTAALHLALLGLGAGPGTRALDME